MDNSDASRLRRDFKSFPLVQQSVFDVKVALSGLHVLVDKCYYFKPTSLFFIARYDREECVGRS